MMTTVCRRFDELIYDRLDELITPAIETTVDTYVTNMAHNKVMEEMLKVSTIDVDDSVEEKANR